MTPRPGRQGIAVAVGEWSARHRKSAVFGWLLFVVLATALGSMTGTVKSTDVQNGVGESGRATRMLADAGVTPRDTESVLVHSGTATVSDPGFRATVADTVDAVRGAPGTTAVRDPYAPGGTVSADRHSVLVTFALTGDPDTAADRVGPVLDAVAGVGRAHPGLTVAEYGTAGAAKDFDAVFASDFGRAEYSAVPLALGILLVVFGAVVAAVAPVLLAVTAFVAAYGLLGPVSHVLPTDDNAASLMLLVGLAVGVDYCLFYLRRWREERGAGRDPGAALRVAAATSGHSVLVSGLTVVVALAGMFLTGITTFKAMGMAAILVVVVAVGGSVTVLPAVLAMLGDRIGAGRVPYIGRRRERAEGGSRWWRAVLTPVLARPAWAAGIAVVALLALASPLTGMRTAQLTPAQELPRGDAMIATARAVQRAFPGDPQPARVVVASAAPDGPAMTAAVAELTRRVTAAGAVRGEVTVAVHPRAGLLEVDVPLAGDGTGTDRASERALTAVRSAVRGTVGAVPGARAAVGGVTAMSADFSHQLSDSALPVFGFVLVLCFVLMLLSFRSPVIALTAVVLNLLSVGAAYGVLTLVFQHGVGVSLLGTYRVGAIESWLPLFLFVILFGLSMDYHVFVVSRIKEGRDAGLGTREAIARGIAGTAGVVTSAAVIMVGVFSIFGTLSVMSMKQIGVGLAAAVVLDATVIRGVLLPAVMALLGEANWWGPLGRSAVHARTGGAVSAGGAGDADPDEDLEPIRV